MPKDMKVGLDRWEKCRSSSNDIPYAKVCTGVCGDTHTLSGQISLAGCAVFNDRDREGWGPLGLSRSADDKSIRAAMAAQRAFHDVCRE